MTELTNTHYKSGQILRQISDLVNLRNEENSNLKIMAKTVTSSEDVDMHKYMERIEQIVDYTEINTEHSWTDSSESGTSSQKSVCAFPFYTLAIHSDGQVSPCCVDWSKKEVYGNALTENLYDIWRNSNIESLRVAHLKGDLSTHQGCNGCDYFIENCPDNIDKLKNTNYNFTSLSSANS